MFCVAHIFIHTFPMLIFAQVCTEEIDIFDVAHVFFHRVPKLILAQVCIE